MFSVNNDIYSEITCQVNHSCKDLQPKGIFILWKIQSTCCFGAVMGLVGKHPELTLIRLNFGIDSRR